MASAIAAIGLFLGTMAWTGLLKEKPNAKSEILGWIVDDVFVTALGRQLASLAFVSMGGALALAIVKYR